MRTLCIIPARGGSKGLKRKNVRILSGRPLIHWPVMAALKSSCIDDVFVTTDDEEIGEQAIIAGAQVPFLRPKSLAEDLTTTEDTLRNALLEYEAYKGIKYDICVFLTATDIFRDVSWIREAVQVLTQQPDIESAFVAYKTTKNYWLKGEHGKWERVLQWMRDYSSRQVRQAIYREDTGLGCASRSWLWREGRRIGDNVHLIVNSNSETFVDIHEEMDLYMAEMLISYLQRTNGERVNLFMGNGL